MRQFILRSLLCLCFAFPLAAATAADFAAQGEAALLRRDAEKAVELLEKAVAADANNAEYHYLLGTAYGEVGTTAGALKKMSMAKKTMASMERAVELNPNHVDARLALAGYYAMAPGMMGGGDDKALAQAAEVKKRDGIEGHRAYARIYTLQKKTDLARKEYVEAVRENPKSARAHYLLGNFYLTEKNWDASLHELQMALQLDPAYMPTYLRLGQHAANSGKDYARGEEALRKYLAHSPTLKEPSHGLAWMALGTIQEKQGKKNEAKASYANALKLTPGDKSVTEALKRVS